MTSELKISITVSVLIHEDADREAVRGHVVADIESFLDNTWGDGLDTDGHPSAFRLDSEWIKP